MPRAIEPPDRTAPLQGSTVGERIKAAYLRAGLKRAAFARMVDVSYPTVENWEHGRTKPQADNLQRIADVTGFSASEIDNGRLRARVVSPWLEEREDLRRVSRYERGLAQRALDAGAVVADHDLVYAVPIIDGAWRRVVVIAEAEQLATRFDG